MNTIAIVAISIVVVLFVIIVGVLLLIQYDYTSGKQVPAPRNPTVLSPGQQGSGQQGTQQGTQDPNTQYQQPSGGSTRPAKPAVYVSTYADKHHIEFRQDPGWCIGTGKYGTDANLVVARPCTDPTTSWTYDPSTQQIISMTKPGKCIGLQSDPQNGVNAVITDCGAANTQFQYDEVGGQLHIANNPALCLHRSLNDISAESNVFGIQFGNVLHSWTCMSGLANDVFDIKA